MNLAGRKIIVTGGVNGLGRAVVEGLLEKHASVTIFDTDVEGLNTLAEHSDVTCIRCDVSDYDQVAAAAAEFHAKLGSADALINNAGILYSAPLVSFGSSGLTTHDIAAWNNVIATDLNSVFYVTVAIVEKMIQTRKKGVIVNISSVSASGNPGQSAYSAAKAGVNAMTVAWARELGPMGIRVAAVAPGFSETESTKQAVAEGVLKDIVKRVPVRRLGKSEEIASAVVWVLENDFFNGKILEVDGGLIV